MEEAGFWVKGEGGWECMRERMGKVSRCVRVTGRPGVHRIGRDSTAFDTVNDI